MSAPGEPPGDESETTRRIRAFDWATTPLGPIEQWPQDLKALLLEHNGAAELGRQSFLLRLSDALRPLETPQAMQQAACRLLGEALGIDRVYYVDFSTEPEFGIIADDYSADGLPSLAGRYPVASFRTSYQRHLSGSNWVVRDALRDAGAEHEAQYCGAHNVTAWVDVPLLKAGKLRGVLSAVQTTARNWTEEETALIAEAAARLGASVEQARAETGLRRAEERTRMVLEAGRMGTWRYNLATGLQEWSEQQFRLFGLDPARGPPTRELFVSMVHPEDRHLIEFTDDDLLPGRGLLDAEFRIIRADGEICWLVSHTTVRHDASGAALEMIGLNWDITERKRAEQALRNSEEGLRMALDAGRMGTYRFDVKTGIETWDDNEYSLLGLERTAEPPTRELFLSLVHPDDLHLVAFTADDRRPPGTSLDSEFRIVRPDTGEVRHLTAHALARFGPDGRPIELIGVNQDVTEEREIQAALRATEERMQQFSEASSDVLWIRDVQTMQWTYLGPAFDRIYGISRQDALRDDNYRSWLGFIVPEDRAGAEAALRRVAAGERIAFEFRIRRPDGEIRWLRNTDFPIRDESGTVTGVAGVGSDITLIKQAEEHQQMLLFELQHRVRNTLSVIRSIVRRTAATSDGKDDFQMHLEGRIDTFARVQAAVTRDPAKGVDLEFLLAEELRIVGATEGQNLSVGGPPIALSARAAETFGLAIHELATNAVKYGALLAPQGGIDIGWRILGDAPARLRFEWSERGVPGMPPEPRRRGFGSEILERTMAYDLKAVTTLEFRPTGILCTITIPMAQLNGPPHSA